MRPIATDGLAWLSVCLLVKFVSAAKNGWTDPEFEMCVSESRLGWVQGTIYKMGVEIAHEKGQFRGLSGPLRSIGSPCCGNLRSKKISNGDSGTATGRAAIVQTGRCHNTQFPVKKLTLWCGLLSKMFSPLVRSTRVRCTMCKVDANTRGVGIIAAVSMFGYSQVRPSSGTDVNPHMPILRPHAVRYW